MSFPRETAVWVATTLVTGGASAGGLTQAALTFAAFSVIVGLGQLFVITLGPGNVDLSIPANMTLAGTLALKAIDAFSERVQELRRCLEANDYERLGVLIREANQKAEDILHRANLRGDDIIRDANELLQKASDRADEIISEANDKKLAEEREYDRVRLEVTRFKSDVLNLYRTHVESLSRLPEFQQKDETPAQDAEAELPETEDADTTEEAAPAADAAETEDAAPEKAGEDFWEKDESQLKLDPPPADPNAVFQGVSFSE